jgi:isochorismate synthase
LGPPNVLFDSPSRETGLWGWGLALERAAQTTDEADGLLDELTTRQWVEPLDALSTELPGPWLGGLAFDAGRTRALGEWEGFGLARFVIPAWVLWWRQGKSPVLTHLFGGGVSVAQARAALAERAAWLSSQSSHPSQPQVPLANVVATGAAGYRRAVVKALEEISGGRLQKVMVARALEVEAASPFDLGGVVLQLRTRFPTCTTFLLEGSDGACFLGATPERLCVVEGQELRTEALAGTSRPELAEALLSSEKDLREHQEVVDGIREALSPLAEEVQVPNAPALKHLPNVSHLHTPIEATLRLGVSAAQVLRALHPTPSVGGTPRQDAFSFLAANEGLERGWYAGPVGLFGATRTEAFVALRCALVRGTQARVYVGAGIVRGSTPEAELAETSFKASALLGVLGAQESHGG